MAQKLMLAAGLLLLADAVILSFTSNFNFGLFAVFALGALLLLWGLFKPAVDAATAHGPLHALKLLFFAGCAVYAAIFCFLLGAGGVSAPTGEERAVIVLGGGLRGDVPNHMLARRLDAAYNYYINNPGVTIVCSGGQGPQELMAEGEAMRNYLLAKGIPEDRVFAENLSTSTQENFRFSLALLNTLGIEKDDPIAFATSRFHCYRSAQYAAMEGLTRVSALPAPISPTVFLPCYLREVAAVVLLWLRRAGLPL